MNEPAIENLLVDFYFANAQVFGIMPRVQVEVGRRLVDVLSNSDELLGLRAGNVRLAAGGDTRTLENFSLKKSEILIAVPRETQDQIRHRAHFRSGIDSIAGVPLSVGLLLPPFYVEGSLSATVLMAKRLDVHALERFFIVTRAAVWLPDGSRHAEPFMVVNRDEISAIGELEEASANSKMEAPLSYAPRREA